LLPLLRTEQRRYIIIRHLRLVNLGPQDAYCHR